MLRLNGAISVISFDTPGNACESCILLIDGDLAGAGRAVVPLDCFACAASRPSELCWPTWHRYEAPGWVLAPLGQEASSSRGAPANHCCFPLKHSCLWDVERKCKTKTPFVLLWPVEVCALSGNTAGCPALRLRLVQRWSSTVDKPVLQILQSTVGHCDRDDVKAALCCISYLCLKGRCEWESRLLLCAGASYLFSLW